MARPIWSGASERQADAAPGLSSAVGHTDAEPAKAFVETDATVRPPE
jgi:hypothetical protein